MPGRCGQPEQIPLWPGAASFGTAQYRKILAKLNLNTRIDPRRNQMPENEVMLEGLAIEECNILVKASAASSTDIIQQLGALLYNNGFVKETYVQAVIDREQIYPTGLQTSELGFAIPHTNTEHVSRPAVAIATLEQPV